ncbi:MAG TPA: hypothetical protein VNN21_09620 [Dehalococcoidia bacterium]|nr:hypothetical protein [Dehalococcoidia bacterium]
MRATQIVGRSSRRPWPLLAAGLFAVALFFRFRGHRRAEALTSEAADVV